MAEELNDYGPAFPIAGTHYGEVQWHHGVSKCEYYAERMVRGVEK